MKKLLFSFILGLLIFPIFVNAEVTSDTLPKTWLLSEHSDAANLCYVEEELNTANLASATRGFYLYCVSVSCISSENIHAVAHPFSSSVTCANGNTNPSITVRSSGASGVELANGSSCVGSGIYAYGTEIVYYDCGLLQNGEDYVNDDPNPPTVPSPQTGINDYFIVLGGSVAVLSTLLYIFNKKNIFKKI